MTDGAISWICPSCKMRVSTPFCGSCGEEPLAPRDLTLRGLAEKVLHALTSIDARAARSAWQLLRYPGHLTRAWMSGIRKAYVAPFQLFLIANLIFFALQSLTKQSVFSSSLDSHLHHQDWSDLAQSLVASRLEATHTRLAQYAPVFDRSVVLNAKSFIVLMAMLFSLLLPVIFFRGRRPFMAHVVFSFHLYTFLLLVFCVALLAAKLSELAGLGGLETPTVDNVLSVANLAACAVYIYLAIGPVYGATGSLRIGKAILLALAAAAIVVGYRFLLFLITLYAT
jgi:Protein of unknown function (DUF3667)